MLAKYFRLSLKITGTFGTFAFYEKMIEERTFIIKIWQLLNY